MRIIAIFFFLTVFSLLYAGDDGVEVRIISAGEGTDSSYYTLCKVNDREIWAFGKNGVISIFDIVNKTVHPISYPNTGEFIYRAGVFPDGRVMAVGESGLVLIYSPKTKSWDKKNLKGFRKRCIYSLLIIDDSVAYATGGHNLIARSQGVIPHGFIIRTSDGGRTWERIRRFPTSMVWNVTTLPNDKDNLYFSVFCPPFTYLLSYNRTNSNIEYSGIFTGLFHDLHISDDKRVIFCGSAGINYTQNGRIKVKGQKPVRGGKNQGAFWHISRHNKYYVVTGSGGKILISRDLDNWTEINTPLEIALYDAVSIDDESIIVAGQNQTLIKITLSGLQSETAIGSNL